MNPTTYLNLKALLEATEGVTNVRGGHSDEDSICVYFDWAGRTLVLFVIDNGPSNVYKFDAELYEALNEGEAGSDDDAIFDIEATSLEDIVNACLRAAD